MRHFFCLLSLFLFVCSFTWAQQPLKPPANGAEHAAQPETQPSRSTVESFLKHWFGYDPSMHFTVGEITPSEAPGISQVVVGLEKDGQRQTMVLYVTQDQKHALSGELIPFGADPFAEARTKLSASTTGVARGPAGAAVTIVEFSDLQCPHCKVAQPIVDKLLGDFPNARFVFQQFPLEQVHNWAFKAATWAQCVGKENNAAFWKFVESVYSDQLSIDAQTADTKLREHAVAAGVPADKTAACAASPETTRHIRDSLALGRVVGVSGTPTFFINGRKVAGITNIPYETLKAIVQFAETPQSR